MDLTLTIQQIKNCLKEKMGTSTKIFTTLTGVVNLVITKYPKATAEDIKCALANIEGWSAAPSGLGDQIEITAAFFNDAVS